ncbi:MAG: aspartate 1-decarboxylase [Endozoicomonadaceae bacterium]|nr:aspartate 1-decarboxylase [Endozoicomonadaceae bacterium]
MFNVVLKAKLHMVTVTHSELNYDGSCAIDENWLKMTGLREFEQIQIYNKDNGERLTTYIIRAEAGSGIISLNGAAARKASVGDRVIICAYAHLLPEEMLLHKPTMLYFNSKNAVVRTTNSIAVQQLSCQDI